MSCTFAFFSFFFGEQQNLFFLFSLSFFASSCSVFFGLGKRWIYSIFIIHDDFKGQRWSVSKSPTRSKALRWIDYFSIWHRPKNDSDGRRRRRWQYIHFCSHKIICFTWNKHSETLHSLRYITNFFCFFSFFLPSLTLYLAVDVVNASSLSLSLVVGYEDILMGKNNKWTWWEKRKMFRNEYRFWRSVRSPLLLNRRETPSPAAAAASAEANIPWQSYERISMANIRIVMKWRGILKCCWKMSSLMIDWWWTKLFNKNFPPFDEMLAPSFFFFVCSSWFLFYYQFNSKTKLYICCCCCFCFCCCWICCDVWWPQVEIVFCMNELDNLFFFSSFSYSFFLLQWEPDSVVCFSIFSFVERGVVDYSYTIYAMLSFSCPICCSNKLSVGISSLPFFPSLSLFFSPFPLLHQLQCSFHSCFSH